MKKFFVLTTVFLFAFVVSMQSQVSMVVTAGISPQQTPPSHYIFVNRSTPDEFTFDLRTVKSSVFIGAGARYDIKPFFFQAEAQYNKRVYVYDVSYTYTGRGRTDEVNKYEEQMDVINLPLSMGVDLGILDITSGFLPQFILSQQSDLSDLEGYNQDLKTMRFGWHTGIAANVNQLRIGLNWQSDFNNYADHAYIGNQSLELAGRSSRLLGTLSFVF
ncbi:MAG TPA: hypothetical protein VFF90_13360 [Saprospiraceae bacterium]|nr:hypothetical protein [Saprospiraceae bacterium]